MTHSAYFLDILPDIVLINLMSANVLSVYRYKPCMSSVGMCRAMFVFRLLIHSITISSCAIRHIIPLKQIGD